MTARLHVACVPIPRLARPDGPVPVGDLDAIMSHVRPEHLAAARALLDTPEYANLPVPGGRAGADLDDAQVREVIASAVSDAFVEDMPEMAVLEPGTDCVRVVAAAMLEPGQAPPAAYAEVALLAQLGITAKPFGSIVL